MPKSMLSEQQFLSSIHLQRIWDKGICFQIDNNRQFILTSRVEPTDEELIIYTQGLNLEKLFCIQQALSQHLQILCFRPGNLVNQTIAIEADVKVTNRADLQAVLEAVAVAHQVELSVLSSRPSLQQPGLLVMDMDSTVIGVECIDEIAVLAGVGEEVSKVTALAMQGELDFAQSLTQRVSCLAGAPATILQQVRDALPIMPGIENLLATLKQAGWKLAIASGGFTYFADYLAHRLELDYAISNVLAIEHGKLTGQVQGHIVDAQVKAHTLTHLAQQWQIPKQQTVAMGDGANDLIMMGEAGLGVALHAKPVVRQQADSAIRFGAADTLLTFLQR